MARLFWGIKSQINSQVSKVDSSKMKKIIL